jgi:hypothetical protein
VGQRDQLRFKQALQEALGFGGILLVGAQLLDQRPLSRNVLIDFRQMMLRLVQVLVSQSHGTTTRMAGFRCTCEKEVCVH